jgi:polyhydroxyalkanoate synthesis repressor PhaR
MDYCDDMPKPASPRRRGRPPAVAVPTTGVVIKKYGNRRLYDTRGSRYINLQELLDLFAAEDDVRVIDALAGDDLTERTLTQALLAEEGQRGGSLLPIELMRALVRHRRGSSRLELERHLLNAIARFERG